MIPAPVREPLFHGDPLGPIDDGSWLAWFKQGTPYPIAAATVLSNGTSITPVKVDLSSCVPSKASAVWGFVYNINPAVALAVGSTETVAGAYFFGSAGYHPLPPLPIITPSFLWYQMSGAGGGGYIYITGYIK